MNEFIIQSSLHLTFLFSFTNPWHTHTQLRFLDSSNPATKNKGLDMLDTGTIIATIIALGSALTVMGLAIKENIRLNSENAWLRQRNQELKKLVN